MKVFVRPEADRDIHEACLWYARQSPGLGDRFLDEVASVLRSIGRRPTTYPILERATRAAVMRRFPYLVLFNSSEGHVTVTGVFDGRRHPRSWSDRVRESARLLLAGALD